MSQYIKLKGINTLMKIKMMSLLFSLLRISLIAAACLVAAGCGTPQEKRVLSRGWVGGQVKLVNDFPKSLIPRPKSAILVTALATNTPAAAAGLQPGDLILALDHEPVVKLRDFHHKIDLLAPGTSLPITAWRDGRILDYTLIVGRETYHNGGVFTVYFPGISGNWNLWPGGENPGLSLIALGYQINSTHRTELGSVEKQYRLKCAPNDHPYNEDYKFWVGIMSFSSGKRIVGQEIAEAAK
jgi:membrane-associated protease RseP (regulator of RpoE activity)